MVLHIGPYLFLWRQIIVISTVVQSQNTVTAYFSSRRLQPFRSERQSSCGKLALVGPLIANCRHHVVNMIISDYHGCRNWVVGLPHTSVYLAVKGVIRHLVTPIICAISNKPRITPSCYVFILAPSWGQNKNIAREIMFPASNRRSGSKGCYMPL